MSGFKVGIVRLGRAAGKVGNNFFHRCYLNVGHTKAMPNRTFIMIMRRADMYFGDIHHVNHIVLSVPRVFNS